MSKKQKPKELRHRSMVAYEMIVSGLHSRQVPDRRKKASREACRGRVQFDA